MTRKGRARVTGTRRKETARARTPRRRKECDSKATTDTVVKGRIDKKIVGRDKCTEWKLTLQSPRMWQADTGASGGTDTHVKHGLANEQWNEGRLGTLSNQSGYHRPARIRGQSDLCGQRCCRTRVQYTLLFWSAEGLEGSGRRNRHSSGLFLQENEATR